MSFTNLFLKILQNYVFRNFAAGAVKLFEEQFSNLDEVISKDDLKTFGLPDDEVAQASYIADNEDVSKILEYVFGIKYFWFILLIVECIILFFNSELCSKTMRQGKTI